MPLSARLGLTHRVQCTARPAGLFHGVRSRESDHAGVSFADCDRPFSDREHLLPEVDRRDLSVICAQSSQIAKNDSQDA